MAYLCVVLTDRPILMPRNNISAQVTPRSHSSFTLTARDDQTPLITLLRSDIDLHIQHHYRPQEPHSLLRHREQFRPILVKLYSFDGRIEVPYFYALARADVPEADGIVGGAGGEEGGARVDVDGPEGALVAVIGTEAFAVGGEPGADYLIFGAGEEYVAVFGVSVSFQSQRSLRVRAVWLGGRCSLDLSQGPFL